MTPRWTDVESTTLAMLLILILFALIASGTYIGVALVVIGFFGIALLRSVSVALSQLTQIPFSATAAFAFSVIPMFMLMGEAALRSGLTTRLYNGFNLWLGRLPGGLGLATIATSGMFAAISGSGVAVTLMMSRVAIPEMRRAGYRDGFSGTVLASAGSFAVLIPPSAMLVVYALLVEISIGRALIAGLLPGLLTIAAYMATVVIWAVLRPESAPRGPTASWGERARSIQDLLPVVLVATVVVGGIYTGFLTPTESAAAGAFAVIALGLVRRGLDARGLYESGRNSVIATTQVFLILIGAFLFGRFIALSGIGNRIVLWIEASGISPLAVMLVIVVVYLVLGTFLEGMSALVITVPIFAPVVAGLGFDLFWFGVIVVKLIEISVITPPLGFNVLVLKGAVPDIEINAIWRRVIVFVVIDLILVATLFAFPQIVLFLPSRM